MHRDKLIQILENEIADVAKCAEILHCTRQYINELVSRNKLIPIKKCSKYTLFSKSEVLDFYNNKK